MSMKEIERTMPSYKEVVALLGWFPSPVAYRRAVGRGFTNPHMFKRPNETKAQRVERQRNMMAWNGTVAWVWGK